jgi:hypothetical protein
MNDVSERLRQLQNMELHIGVFAEDDSEIAMIANVQESGSVKLHIPARSFIGAGFDKFEKDIAAQIRNGLPKVIKGILSPYLFYDRLGEYVVGRIVKRVNDGLKPENAPSTLAAKAPKDKPLIDSGALLQHVTHKVVKR